MAELKKKAIYHLHSKPMTGNYSRVDSDIEAVSLSETLHRVASILAIYHLHSQPMTCNYSRVDSDIKAVSLSESLCRVDFR